jgi:hypothetical protein
MNFVIVQLDGFRRRYPKVVGKFRGGHVNIPFLVKKEFTTKARRSRRDGIIIFLNFVLSVVKFLLPFGCGFAAVGLRGEKII